MNLFVMLLLAASAAYGIARWLRLPALPVLIGAGMALNYAGVLPEGFLAGTGEAEEHEGAAMRLLEFGLVFLVFAYGVELNPRRFARLGSTVVWVGALQFGVSALLGFATSRGMGFNTMEAVYLGFGLAASSTLVVLHQLRTRHAMFEPFGRLVTGVLLLQDVLLIGTLVVLSRLTGGMAAIGWGIGEMAVLGGAAWMAQRHLVPRLVKRMKPDEESLLLWLVAVLFLFVGIALSMGLPAIVGAFAGGFAFSGFPLNGLVRGQLSSLTQFFQALFFVALGALVGIPNGDQWWTSLQFAAVVVFITLPLVTILAERRGLSTRAALESGLLLAQTSEFSLLLGLTGLAVGHLSLAGFGILALTTVITMTLTPIISRERVAHALISLHPFRRQVIDVQPPKNHVLVLGFGSAGMWTLKPLHAQGEEVLVVDDDAVVCRELARRGIRVMRGDGSEKIVLDRAGAANAKFIIVSMRRVGEALKVLEHVRGIPVFARVFEESEAHQIREAGGIPVLNSKASADTFLDWFGANDRMKS